MTEKRYALEQWSSLSLYYSFPDGNLHHSIGKVIARVENDLNSLYNENEQLKQEYQKLKHRHSLLHDECLDLECDKDRYYKDVLSLEEENKELKQQLGKLAEFNQKAIW